MILNGNVKSVFWFVNLILLSSSPSQAPKIHLEGVRLFQFKSLITIWIGRHTPKLLLQNLLNFTCSFDIEDRKGLEIVILSALLSFQDAFDDSHAKREDPVSLPSLPSSSISNLVVTPEEVRARTPKPKKTGVEQVAERQKGDLQDITVFDEGEVLDYAQYCANFLEVCPGPLLETLIYFKWYFRF